MAENIVKVELKQHSGKKEKAEMIRVLSHMSLFSLKEDQEDSKPTT